MKKLGDCQTVVHASQKSKAAWDISMDTEQDRAFLHAAACPGSAHTALGVREQPELLPMARIILHYLLWGLPQKCRSSSKYHNMLQKTDI